MASIFETHKISRRTFCTAGIPALVAAFTGLCEIPALQPLPPTSTPRHTITPPLLSTSPSHADYMAATATAMEHNHADTSFVPEGLFTQEFFNTLLRSTCILTIDLGKIDPNHPSNTVYSSGTAWCVRTGPDSLYFVTNRHILLPTKTSALSGLANLQLIRPLISGPLPLSKAVCSITNPHDASLPADLAVVKIWTTPETIKSFSPLSYQPHYQPTPGEKMLIVGFPATLRGNQSDTLAKSSGNIAPVMNREVLPDLDEEDPLSQAWPLAGLFDFGGSGSPVAIATPDAHNQPMVVGVATASDMLTKTPYPYPGIAIPLNIDRLLTDVDHR